MRRALPFAFLLCLAYHGGCERETSPAPPGSAKPSPLELHSSLSLRDWVRNPPVAPEEADAPVPRIVSAAPSVTEICCALGLGEYLVGRTRYCRYPPEVQDLPMIGALEETNAEVLLALRPDLVLVSGSSRAVTDRLERLGLRFETLPDVRLVDVFSAIERVGELTNRPKTAQRLNAALRADLDAVAARCAALPATRVLIVLAPLADPPAPPFVAGQGSLQDDLLQRAGLRNAADLGGKPYAPLAIESIVRSDPDVIIELDADGAGRPGGDAAARQAWAALGPLKAVRDGRVHVLPGMHHHLPGPRVALSLLEICDAIAEGAREGDADGAR